MKRRSFLKTSGLAMAGSAAALHTYAQDPSPDQDKPFRIQAKPFPLAITMWEFSWLERRWPGAGYEDWDQALSELAERGYDAVRIDAFPHLVAAAPEKKWSILPHWDNQKWGSPYYTEVQVQPNLNDFIRACQRHGIGVGLSTWWREDSESTAKKISSPKDLGKVWRKTLQSIEAEDLLDNVIYVDLSNEYPISVWTPYLPENTRRNSELGQRYAHGAVKLLKKAYPDMPFCLSVTTEYDKWETEDTSMQDLLECHIWIANSSGFNRTVGYNFQRFGNDDYKNLQLNAQRVYREKESYYLGKLKERIELCSKWSEKAVLPLGTTECWGPIDYKDMPLLDWGWVKEACAYGVEESSKSGRWLLNATSNFCGPQFVTMWRDVDWHRRLTDIIHKAPVADDLQNSLLAKRMQLLARP